MRCRPARARHQRHHDHRGPGVLVREVGGDKVTVEALAKGYQDPHFVEAKPSFVLKLHSADLLIVVGRELEIGWLPPLITQSRNAKIQPGGAGYLDASLDRADPRHADRARSRARWATSTRRATRTTGSIPENGRRIAKAIQDKLTQMSRGRRGVLRAARTPTSTGGWPRREKRWKAAMAPYKGLKVVTYHRSWPNFADAFGLDVVGYVEPKPGIPPSPAAHARR